MEERRLKIAAVLFMQRNLKSRRKKNHLQCGFILNQDNINHSLLSYYFYAQKFWNSWRELFQSHLSTFQSLNEGTALVSAGANGLSPALPEQTRHCRLVCQTESVLVLQSKDQKKTENSMRRRSTLATKIFFSNRMPFWTYRHKLNKLTVCSAPGEGLPCSRPTAVQSEWRHLGWLDTSWPLLCQSLWRQQRACPHH